MLEAKTTLLAVATAILCSLFLFIPAGLTALVNLSLSKRTLTALSESPVRTGPYSEIV